MSASSLSPPSVQALLPLAEEIVPAPAPWLTARQLAQWPGLLFFDSSSSLPELGRFSFLCAGPFLRLRSRGSQAFSIQGHKRTTAWGDPFAMVQDCLRKYRLQTLPGLPLFQGGAAGLFGYELCRHLERVPATTFAEFPIPELAVNVYGWVIAWDHIEGRAWLIANGFPHTTPRAFQRQARRRLAKVRERLSAPPAAPRTLPHRSVAIQAPQTPVLGVPALTSNFSRERYLRTIERAIEYINAGDCFQVNIAQRLLTSLPEHPLDVFQRLRTLNPAPFAAYFDLGNYAIASASPERFLFVQDGLVQTRPIKGTQPRGFAPAEDMARAALLQASAKDRAENVMIVDLLRNDLGRVCAYGSVKVEALCRLESFRFVHHLVSEVRGRLRPGLDAVDLLRATFPGGSVTGAPKVRAMEIISELEQTARGPYCGCLGYLGFDGTMDTNLLIRTLILGGGWAQFSVGGGIVADSNPDREYEETWHKAEGLLRALQT